MLESTEMHTPWTSLEAELDKWAEGGQIAQLWWRDDDAVAVSSSLTQLLNVSANTPIAIAAIPAPLTDDLTHQLSAADTVVVLPHGYAHVNHAPDGEKNSEFGPHRPLNSMIAEVDQGWKRLQRLLPKSAKPIFVPPWNRIDMSLAPHLEKIGINAISTFGPIGPSKSIKQINVHVDIIDWRGSRKFVGEELAVAALTHHLSSQRGSDTQFKEPSGLMTHHLVHDLDCWRFIERLLEETHKHPAAQWVSAEEILESL